MKNLFSIIALCSLLMACSQGNQSAKTDTSGESTNTDAQHTKSIFAPYTEEAVKTKLNEMQMIIDNGHVYLPAEVKEAESYVNGWNKYPDMLKAMMESDLNPNQTQNVDDTPPDEETSIETSAISARGRITAQESQSAFNVPGAIDYFIEIQSTNEQPFTLQGLKINRGRCGFSTGDFYSKLPVTLNYSQTVKYLLKCKGDQVLEAELITDQGSLSITF